jgi:hypothetical protein
MIQVKNMKAKIHESDRARKEAIDQLYREAASSKLWSALLLLPFFPLLIIWWTDSLYRWWGIDGTYVVMFSMALLVILSFELYTGRFAPLEEARALLELEPLIKAYRNCQSFVAENPPEESSEVIKSRDYYIRLAQLAENWKEIYEERFKYQIRRYQVRKCKDDGVTPTSLSNAAAFALLNDVDDALKQARKELLLLDKAYHSTETPRIIVAQSPISSPALGEQTGLERY